MSNDGNSRGSLTGAGCALVGIGLLILIPSGLCTGFIAVGSLVEAIASGNAGDLYVTLTYTLLIGGIPMALGAGLFWTGWKERRKK